MLVFFKSRGFALNLKNFTFTHYVEFLYLTHLIPDLSCWVVRINIFLLAAEGVESQKDLFSLLKLTEID